MSSVWVGLGYLWACTAWDEKEQSFLNLEYMRRGGHGRWLGLRLCVS